VFDLIGEYNFFYLLIELFGKTASTVSLSMSSIILGR